MIDKDYNKTYYIAPTVYKLAGITTGQVPRVNFYNTLDKAIAQYNHFKKGTPAVNSSGSITITTTAAETIGINVDFYLPLWGTFYPASYETVKKNFKDLLIGKITPTSGASPVFILVNPSYMGIAAKAINADEFKVKALDEFHREVQLLKYRYNSLASFLNQLSKKELSAKEQQIFNEGLLKLQNLNNQIRSIDGIEIFYNENGTIGAIPILLIAVIAIIAGATAWTLSKITTEKEKTKRINDAFELNKWVNDKMHQVANDSNLSNSEKNRLLKNLEQSQKTANSIAEQSTKDSKGLFGNIADIVKFGVIGLVLLKAMQIFDEHKKARA